MAINPVNTPADRVSFFEAGLIRNLAHWQAYLAQHRTNVEGLDLEQTAIVKAIHLALGCRSLWAETWPILMDLIDTFSAHMERRGYWDSWLFVLNQVIEVAQRQHYLEDEVKLTNLYARLLKRQSQYQHSVQQYRRTIRLARIVGDDFTEARACSNLGYYFINQGLWHRAEILSCYALNLFEQLDSDHGRAHTENHLGLLYTRQGRFKQSQHHLERACQLWRLMDDNIELTRGLINLSVLFNEQVLPDKTISVLQEGLPLAKDNRDQNAMAKMYNNLGNAYLLKNDPPKAKHYIRKGEAIYRRLADQRGLARSWNNLGLACWVQGELAEANAYFTQSLALYRSLHNQLGQIHALTYLAECEHSQGKTAQAQGRLRQVDFLLKQIIQTDWYPRLQERLTMLRNFATPHLAKTDARCDILH